MVLFLFLYDSEADGRAAWAAISAAGLEAMPDFGFGRCDGHHEMVDSRLRKKPHCVPSAETASQRSGDHFCLEGS
jgi:hypothetical protein